MTPPRPPRTLALLLALAFGLAPGRPARAKSLRFDSWSEFASCMAGLGGEVWRLCLEARADAKRDADRRERAKPKPVVMGPDVGAGVVCYGTDDQLLVAVDDRTGKRRWCYKSPDRFAEGSRIVFARRTVCFLDHDRNFHGLDEATGRQRWKVKVPAVAPGGATALGELLLVPAADGAFVALEAATGARRWEGRGALRATGAGTVVLQEGDAGVARGIDLASGAERFRLDGDAAPVAPPLANAASLVAPVAGARLLVRDLRSGSDADRGSVALGGVKDGRGLRWTLGSEVVLWLDDADRLRAADLSSGRERWRATVPAGPAAPLVLPGLAVVGSRRPWSLSTTVVAVDLATGAVAWRAKVPMRAHLDQTVLAGDVLYVRRRDREIPAYGLDLATGALRHEVTDQRFRSLRFHAGAVYAIDAFNYLAKLEPRPAPPSEAR